MKCKNLFGIASFICFSQVSFEEFGVFKHISITKVGLFFPSGCKKKVL